MSIVAQLQASPIFRGVSEADLNALIQIMKPQSFPAGHLLFRKGDQGSAMYLIVSGRVRIFTQDKQGNEITLSYQGPSAIFGDFSVLDDQPRSASAVTVEPTTLMALFRDDFLAFLPGHASVGMAMIRGLAERVRHITTYLSKVNDALERLSTGEYDQAIQAIPADRADPESDGEIRALVSAFVDMVLHIRAREEALKASSETGK